MQYIDTRGAQSAEKRAAIVQPTVRSPRQRRSVGCETKVAWEKLGQRVVAAAAAVNR